MTEEKNISWQGLLNLLVVYIIWGSTYLFIRVAVRDQGGFPPFILGGTRVFVGGALLFLIGRIKGDRLRPTRPEMITLLVSGILLWVGGNGLVNWAEQRADSGLASLIIAAIPIWVALIEAILDRKMPTFRMLGALVVGFCGIGILSFPTLRGGLQADILSILGLLLAGLSWGFASVFQSRRSIGLSAIVSAGYQQLIGSVGFGFLILLIGETWQTPSREAWWAWGYLVVFGSLIAFTAYVTALKILPMKIVATYAYVNPVIAVFLGWLVLHETVTLWTFCGAVFVLLGVAGVFRERYRGKGRGSFRV